MRYVQSYISNISFPTSLEEVYDYSSKFNMETILAGDYEGLSDNPEDVYENTIKYESRYTEWTAPKWCKKNDIVFFMHAKTANATISALKTELNRYKQEFSNGTYWILLNSLIRAKGIYDLYGGKIFAIGKISGSTIYEQTHDQNLHWASNIYAPIDSIFLLEKPIDISEINSQIKISRQSSITPVFGDDFDFLKSLILKKNKYVEDYFAESVAEPVPFSKLTDENWLDVLNQYRRSFFLEIQFRTFYVNRLLRFLGDQKTFYRECACYKEGCPTAYVDNVIKFNGKYLPVEVKLSVKAERDIIEQVSKYCNLDSLKLTKDKEINAPIHHEHVLIIDTDHVYLYDHKNDRIESIFDLDNLERIADIEKLKNVVAQSLF